MKGFWIICPRATKPPVIRSANYPSRIAVRSESFSAVSFFQRSSISSFRSFEELRCRPVVHAEVVALLVTAAHLHATLGQRAYCLHLGRPTFRDSARRRISPG